MRPDKNGNLFTGEAKGEWHASREEAVADANRRRDMRIAALKKQIAALEKITFE
jgi:hypothetical protein